MIHYLTEHIDDRIMAYPSRWRDGDEAHMRFVPYRELFAAPRLDPGTYLFADLESLGPAELEVARQTSDQVRAARAGFRVVNPPDRVLFRLALLEKLYAAGINDFQGYRARDAEHVARFPVFVRRGDDHGGTLTPLLEGPRELARALRFLRLQGHRLADLLVVEFCDTRGDDGLFRKYAAFKVGETILPRHVLFGSRWMLKRPQVKGDPELEKEHKAYLEQHPHEDALRRIFDLAGIEYGRIDYGLRRGRIQVWEINTHPTLTKTTPRLTSAFAELEAEPAGAEPLPLSFDPALLARARRERARRRWQGLRRHGIDRLARSSLAKPLTRSLRAVMGPGGATP